MWTSVARSSAVNHDEMPNWSRLALPRSASLIQRQHDEDDHEQVTLSIVLRTHRKTRDTVIRPSPAVERAEPEALSARHLAARLAHRREQEEKGPHF